MSGTPQKPEKTIEEKIKAKNKGNVWQYMLHFPNRASIKSPSASAVVNPSLMHEQL